MSSTGPGPRPREVTVGGWAIPVASAVLVVAVFDRMAGLRSVATRDALAAALTTGWAKDLGITVEDATSFLRVALFVAGTAAAVTGILGIFALQRHGSARIALTVAAVPVVLTTPIVGGLLGIVIGVGTGLMWTRPARDWFAGRPATPREPARMPLSATPARSEPPRDERPAAGSPPEAVPPPTYGWGQAPGAVPPPYPQPGYPPPPYPQMPYPQPGYPPPTFGQPSFAVPAVDAQVPTQVRIACILTWVFSLLTGGSYLLLILGIAVDREGIVKLLRDNASVRDTSLTDSELVGVLVAVSAVIIVWCLAASLLALLTWRRTGAAWVLLLVCIGAAIGFELFALPFSLLHFAASVTAFLLLLRPPVRAWIRRHDVPRVPPTWPGAAAPWPPPPPTQQPPSTAPGPYPPPPEQPSGKPPVW